MPGANHHLLGQQLQRPARSPRQRVRTRHRDQQRLLAPGELAKCPPTRGASAQCRLQPLLDESALGAIHRRRPHPHRGRDHRVAMTLLRKKQYLRAFDPAHPRLARAGQFLQLHALLFVKRDDLSYVHHGLHHGDGDSRSWNAHRVVPCEFTGAIHRTTGTVSRVYSRLHEGQRTRSGPSRHAAILRRHRTERSPNATLPGAPRIPSPHSRTRPVSRSPRRSRGPSKLAMNDHIQSITTSVQRY